MNAGAGEYNPYREVIEDFSNLFVLERHNGKRRAIFCYGVANSGKSKLMDAFEEVFSAFRYRQSASNFALEMRHRD